MNTRNGSPANGSSGAGDMDGRGRWGGVEWDGGGDGTGVGCAGPLMGGGPEIGRWGLSYRWRRGREGIPFSFTGGWRKDLPCRCHGLFSVNSAWNQVGVGSVVSDARGRGSRWEVAAAVSCWQWHACNPIQLRGDVGGVKHRARARRGCGLLPWDFRGWMWDCGLDICAVCASHAAELTGRVGSRGCRIAGSGCTAGRLDGPCASGEHFAN
ncbi:hypothetical protein SETIT_1G367100v2 [Setaria italica]|uniref:Uncharacterized protein n=1 Tax=Setaria italica TaxID=4555 RepID=A0A368PTI7_SETIT|nr:hypothetical protein SETIT_1G367100v2 [Setaria italica]